MVERRMRKSIRRIGAFWYTAWKNAGSPDLSELIGEKPKPQKRKKKKKKLKIIDREAVEVGYVLPVRPLVPTEDLPSPWKPIEMWACFFEMESELEFLVNPTKYRWLVSTFQVCENSRIPERSRAYLKENQIPISSDLKSTKAKIASMSSSLSVGKLCMITLLYCSKSATALVSPAFTRPCEFRTHL